MHFVRGYVRLVLQVLGISSYCARALSEPLRIGLLEKAQYHRSEPHRSVLPAQV